MFFLTKQKENMCQTCIYFYVVVHICSCFYHKPGMEYDTEGQVESREHYQGSKSLQQYGNQANLEHVGVE